MSKLRYPEENVRALRYRELVKLGFVFLLVLAYGVVEWIRIDEPAQFGLIDYYRIGLLRVPNDYLLLISWSALSLLITIGLSFSQRKEKAKRGPFREGVLSLIPVFGNLFIVLFLLYLIAYRGLWSFTELKEGFSLAPVIEAVLFMALGLYGYKKFSHLFRMRKL